MLNKFRPRMECLEGRDVPAAFSFQFADGTAGGGSFSAPAGVDATQARQELAITDLEVTAQNDEFFVRGDAVAIYSYGVLLGVSASVFGDSSNEIRIDPWGAVAYGFANDGSASVAYDAADTQATFAFSGGPAGAMSYQTPWNLIDETQASQSIPLTVFNLNIAGQNFTYGSASFTTAPTAEFEYGEFKGLSFALNTATSNIGYSSISMSGFTTTAVLAGTTTTLTTNAQAKPEVAITGNAQGVGAGQVKVDFSWKACDGAKSAKIVEVDAQGNPIVGGAAAAIPLPNAKKDGKGDGTLQTTTFNGNVRVRVQILDATGKVIGQSDVKMVQTK